jgi:hypothetical protein
VPFAIALGAGIWLHGKRSGNSLRRGLGLLSIPLFAFVAVTTILAGLAMPLLFLGHILWTGDAREELGQLAGDQVELWPQLLGRSVDGFNRGFERGVLAVLLLTGALYLLAKGAKIVRAVWRELFPPVGERDLGRWLTLVYALGSIVLSQILYQEAVGQPPKCP